MPISYMHQREILVSLFWVFIALTRESCQGWQTQPGVQFVGSCAASQPACQCWTCSYVCLALPPGRQHSPIRQCFREVECQSKLRPSVGCLSQFSPFAHKVSAVFFFFSSFVNYTYIFIQFQQYIKYGGKCVFLFFLLLVVRCISLQQPCLTN